MRCSKDSSKTYGSFTDQSHPSVIFNGNRMVKRDPTFWEVSRVRNPRQRQRWVIMSNFIETIQSESKSLPLRLRYTSLLIYLSICLSMRLSIYSCIHIFIYLFIYLFMYLLMCVWNYIRISIYTCIYIYLHMNKIHASAYIYIYIYICTFVCVCMFIYIDTCIYIYIYIYTYIYIHVSIYK